MSELFGKDDESPKDHELIRGVAIPPALLPSVQRHQANLVRLAGNLRSAGLSAGQIEESINMLVDTYRAELINAMRAIMGGNDG